MASVYEIVTNTIIEKLEQGVIPWRTPWVNRGGAVNWKNQKPYRGINALLLEPGEYATFNQISEAGGKVKKGEKANIVVFWKWLEDKDPETGEETKIPLLRYYKVFEINRQVEGLQSKRKTDIVFENDPIEAAEKIVKGYEDSPKIKFGPGRAYYSPSLDFISVPPLNDYKQPEEYYSTLFHEMVHSTGHQARLNREGVTKQKVAFGDETYSKEELVAEIGSAMLCNIAGIEHAVIDNQASYIHSWLRKLKEDKKLIIQAAGQGQKAADFILNQESQEAAE